MSFLDGRMRRRNFGLFMIAYFVLSMGIGALSSMGMVEALQTGKLPDPATINQPRWLFILLPCLFILAFTVAIVRRLNDLNWSPVLGYLIGAASLASTIYASLYFEQIMNDAMQGRMPPAQIANTVIGGVTLIFALVLVFKRGTVGPNPHGPDPHGPPVNV